MRNRMSWCCKKEEKTSRRWKREKCNGEWKKKEANIEKNKIMNMGKVWKNKERI